MGSFSLWHLLIVLVVVLVLFGGRGKISQIMGAVALVVIGPKQLPGALKTFAYWMRQARKLAREFQSGVDDMIRQAELDEAKQAVEDARRKINRDIENTIDSGGEMKQALSGDPAKPPTPSVPVS